MIAAKKYGRVAVGAMLVGGAMLAFGQSPLLGGMGRTAAKRAAVEYLYPEQITLPAGRPGTVTLHFRVAPGMHINSHTPREGDLIPTTFSIPEGEGVRLEGATFPPGADFRLPQNPGAKLSVYTGEFTVRARLVAKPGNHMVEGRLRYQACEHDACMPPKTITAAMNVVGK